ncbi:hypothetical protein HanRHA438_Chr10g0479841 [Helianthus annuus]|nr:hypothetical protein HanRHA438_Chr10g0479841 [Helianthus annuus]
MCMITTKFKTMFMFIKTCICIYKFLQIQFHQAKCLNTYHLAPTSARTEGSLLQQTRSPNTPMPAITRTSCFE